MPSTNDAEQYIGCKVLFLFYPGWEEPERMTGWLHGVTRSDPQDQDRKIWLSISDDPVLPVGEDTHGLGGYAADWFEVIQSASLA